MVKYTTSYRGKIIRYAFNNRIYFNSLDTYPHS